MLASVNIKDYMIINPVTILPGAQLSEAVQSIIKHKISGLCVVDDNKMLLGVLSEMDCLKAFMDATYNSNNVGIVEEYMSIDVDVVQMNDNIINVANDMLLKGQRRRPVTDKGKLIGQISCRQILQMVEAFSQRASYA
ncbi:MAG: CBS domain-containing protein [Spongiibacteraceae bacterium]